MPNYFRDIYLRHKEFWNKKRFFSLLMGILILLVAMGVQGAADEYVGDIKGIAVGDIVLDHIPSINLDFFIVQGSLIVTFIILGLVLIKPKYLIFTMKAIAVFVVVRSISISLTHLGVDPRELPLNTHSFGFGLYNLLYNSKNDFFFSGHTGVPFLMALIFWQHRFWKLFFLGVSFLFAASVLLAHIHYSIDVFAAPFITYTIFVIAQYFFPADAADALHKEPEQAVI